MRRGDAWLFLTPEVEIEAPALVERLDPSRERLQEAARIDGLVARGGALAWFEYLRELRVLAEAARADGRDPAAVERLGLVLREQHLLAPGARDPALPSDPREHALVARLCT